MHLKDQVFLLLCTYAKNLYVLRACSRTALLFRIITDVRSFLKFVDCLIGLG